MKRIKSWLLAIVLAFTLGMGVACKETETEDEPPATTEMTLNLNLHTADIVVGGRVTLKATLSGGAAEIVWTTSDESVATVDDGIVYGVATGAAVITATVGETRASCTVNVSGEQAGGDMQAIPVLDFELAAERIWVGYSFTPSATLKIAGEPVSADVTFSSADTSVVKIENGKIVGVAVGETVITASCTYEGGLYQKRATIVVVEEPVA